MEPLPSDLRALRPLRPYICRVSGECVIGIDLGGTKMLGGVVDAELGVHARAQREVADLDADGILDAALSLIDELKAASASEIFAVGFGIPCTLDSDRHVAVMAVNLPLPEMDFAAVMSERTGLPAFVDNDANVALIAEQRAGAAAQHSHAVLLTIGTGIGGAMSMDGRLYRGAHGAAGEFGHMVIDEDGPPCQGNCPNHGCLEAVASGTALAREALRVARDVADCDLGRAYAEGRRITGPLVTELAHDGDAAARDVIALIGTRLGVGLANIVNILNPEVIVVGGGVIAAGELLLAPAREVVASRALRPAREQVSIVRTRFGVESGMLGAALLARAGLEQSPR